MAFSVDDKVRCIDQSSDYRNRVGTVQSVSGELHDVRLGQSGCASTVPLLTDQLQADTTVHPTSYAQCSG